MWHNVQTRQALQRKNLPYMNAQTKLGATRMLLIAGAAVILLGTSGIAAVTGWVPSSTKNAAVGADAQRDPAPVEGGPRIRVSCAECAVVLSKRKIEQAGAGAKGYEITVRMKDGSSRAFIEANSANWRPGQRLILIDGAATLASIRE